MRFLTNSMLAVMVAVAITGCSGGSASNSTDNSGSMSSASADNSGAMSSDNSGAMSSDNSGSSSSTDASGAPPDYPGATTQASGSTSGMAGATNATGKVESSTDSFDKVYAWYQKNMPAGSEKSHMETPIKSAVFMTGEAGKDQQSVTITVSGSKTLITIAHVKM